MAVGCTYLLPPLSIGGALVVQPWLRFHIPLIGRVEDFEELRESQSAAVIESIVAHLLICRAGLAACEQVLEFKRSLLVRFSVSFFTYAWKASGRHRRLFAAGTHPCRADPALGRAQPRYEANRVTAIAVHSAARSPDACERPAWRYQ